MPPRKRHINELTQLREPTFSDEQHRYFDEGIALFNEGRYWHAHEAWEHAWLAMGDGSEDDAEIALRGLIQLAAGLHLLGIGRSDGAASNFRKAHEKLSLAGPMFLGVSVGDLVTFLDRQIERLDPGLTCIIERVRG